MSTKRARPRPPTNYKIDSLGDLKGRPADFEALRHPLTTRDFLERLRAQILEEDPELGTVSTYRLALVLDCEWSTVRRWLKGEGTFSHKLAYKIADRLGLPPEYVVACVENERTDDPMLKTMWTRIAEVALHTRRAAAWATITLIAGLGLLTASRPVQAQPVTTVPMESVNGPVIHYAHRKARRRRRWTDLLEAWLTWTPAQAPAWRRA